MFLADRGFTNFCRTSRKCGWIRRTARLSDRVAIAEIGGRRVAFLPRHGKDHRLPPHKINYRANLWAMKELGVKRILGPCAAGSLQPHVKPGDFVICDQFVNRTWGRDDTFFEGPTVDPHQRGRSVLRRDAADAHRAMPKSSACRTTTRARSSSCKDHAFPPALKASEFRSHGWEVINMTQYPEAFLARELGICYANISLITDYDAGLEDDPQRRAGEPSRSAQSISGEHRAAAFAAHRDDRGAAGDAELPLCGCGERRDRLEQPSGQLRQQAPSRRLGRGTCANALSMLWRAASAARLFSTGTYRRLSIGLINDMIKRRSGCRAQFGGIRVTYFSAPPLDERFIEQMFQSSLEALRTTREQVFGIAEAGRDEQNRLMLLLEQVQAELAECIELVDELEIEKPGSASDTDTN